MRVGGGLGHSQRIRLEGDAVGKLIEITLRRVDRKRFRLVLKVFANLLTRFLKGDFSWVIPYDN